MGCDVISLVDVYQTTRRRIPEGKLQIYISLIAEVCDPSAIDKQINKYTNPGH